MDQVIISGFQNALSDIADEYNKVAGGFYWTITEADMIQIVSTPGVFKNLRISLTAAPGAGTSYVFTLRVNGADTLLTCTVSDTNTMCSNTTNQVAVSPGDRVALKCHPVNGPGTPIARWSLIFRGDNARESLVLGTHPFDMSDGTDYNTPNGGCNWQVGEGNAIQIVSTGGHIKNLYIRLQNAPGGVNTVVFTLRVNGADTLLTCTVTGVAITCNDTVNSIVVSPGDRISLKKVASVGFTDGRAQWGMTFEADLDGESLVLGGTDDFLNPAATEYMSPNGVRDTWNALETARRQLGQTCQEKRGILKNLYVYLAVAPGVGTSYTFTLMQNGLGTLLTCTVSGGNIICNNILNEIVIANFDLLSLECAPTNNPAVTTARWGMTYRCPAGWCGGLSPSETKKLIM